MQNNIVTITLIFIHNMFRPYAAIIRCPRYAKLFITVVAFNGLKKKVTSKKATKFQFISQPLIKQIEH
jgi:hypothetical protein